jgi:predicted RND superfamily exporter protein
MNYRELPIAMGTTIGTFLSTFAALKVEDIFVSALLAIMGAILSFLMSCILKVYIKPKLEHFQKKKKKKKERTEQDE